MQARQLIDGTVIYYNTLEEVELLSSDTMSAEDLLAKKEYLRAFYKREYDKLPELAKNISESISLNIPFTDGCIGSALILEGRDDILRQLRQFPNFNTTALAAPNKYLTIFGAACYVKRLDLIRECLEQGVNPDEYYADFLQYSHVPALALCMLKSNGSANDLACLQLLLGKGASRFIHVKGKDGTVYSAFNLSFSIPVLDVYVKSLPNDLVAIYHYLNMKVMMNTKLESVGASFIEKICEPFEVTPILAASLAEESFLLKQGKGATGVIIDSYSVRMEMLYRYVNAEIERLGLCVDAPERFVAYKHWTDYCREKIREERKLYDNISEVLPSDRISLHTVMVSDYFNVRSENGGDVTAYRNQIFGRVNLDYAFTLALTVDETAKFIKQKKGEHSQLNSSRPKYQSPARWSTAVYTGKLRGHTPITAAIYFEHNELFVSLSISQKHCELNRYVDDGPLRGMTPLLLAFFVLHINRKSGIAYKLLSYFVKDQRMPAAFFTGPLNHILPGLSIKDAVEMQGDTKCKKLLESYLNDSQKQNVDQVEVCVAASVNEVKENKPLDYAAVQDFIGDIKDKRKKIGAKILAHRLKIKEAEAGMTGCPHPHVREAFVKLANEVKQLILPSEVSVADTITFTNLYKILDDVAFGLRHCRDAEAKLLALESSTRAFQHLVAETDSQDVKIAVEGDAQKVVSSGEPPKSIIVPPPSKKNKPKRNIARTTAVFVEATTQKVEKDKTYVINNNTILANFNSELELVKLNADAQFNKLADLFPNDDLQPIKNQLSAIHELKNISLIAGDNDDDDLSQLVDQSSAAMRRLEQNKEELSRLRKRFGEMCAEQKQKRVAVQPPVIKDKSCKIKTQGTVSGVTSASASAEKPKRKEPANEYSHLMRSDEAEASHLAATEEAEKKKKSNGKKQHVAKKSPVASSVTDTNVQLTGQVSRLTRLIAQLQDDSNLHQASKASETCYFVNICAMQAKMLAIYELLLNIQASYPENGIFASVNVAASIRNATKHGFPSIVFNWEAKYLTELVNFTLKVIAPLIQKIGAPQSSAKLGGADLPSAVASLLEEKPLSLDLIQVHYHGLMSAIKSIHAKLDNVEVYLVQRETQTQALAMCLTLISMLTQQAHSANAGQFKRTVAYSTAAVRALFSSQQPSLLFSNPEKSEQLVRVTAVLDPLSRLADKPKISEVIASLADTDIYLFLNEIQVLVSHQPEHEMAEYNAHHAHILMRITERLLANHVKTGGKLINELLTINPAQQLLEEWQALGAARPQLMAIYVYELIRSALAKLSGQSPGDAIAGINHLFANERYSFKAFQAAQLKDAAEIALFSRVAELFDRVVCHPGKHVALFA